MLARGGAAVLTVALLCGGSCRDAPDAAPAAEPSAVRDEPPPPPTGEAHPGLRRVIARAAARCQVDLRSCTVGDCVDDLDLVQRSSSAIRDPSSS